ncbi:uncharacterized protein LOC116302751 isoform X2 [Actinia tenebrosa]|uniref:Uncharacterized protein LOC116302751 isoform X2 n=1 Tax=Actinia tenebrosa TaxID=6105 RepID=A0A6P8INN7_ACTTE|nr:uncharacterized protein LOC116302751 isoform X2 [Actinia tenebrosa]
MSSLVKVFLLYLVQALIPRALVYGVTNAVTLSCHSSHMSVQVDLKYFQWLDPQSLHLRHQSCSSNRYNKTSASFVVPLDGCGTRRRTHKDLFIYTNAVSNSNRNSSFISRVPYIRMPFHCIYHRRYSFMLTTGTASKRNIAKKIKNPEKKEILFQEKNGHGISADSNADSLHRISVSILWITSMGTFTLSVSTLS